MTVKNEEAFKLKANFLPITIIKFISTEPLSVARQLQEIGSQAPQFFCQTPVILDLTHVKRGARNVDLAQLMELLREHQLIPVGVQGLLPAEEEIAASLSLPLWRSNAATSVTEAGDSTHEEPQQTEADTEGSLTPHMIITKPVRSGMRIYAKQSNLILLAPVQFRGRMHCGWGYFLLRSRAMAVYWPGPAAILQAQIFCQSLEAELISYCRLLLTVR